MGSLGHVIVLFLIFKGTSILFSIVAVSIYTPTTVQEGSIFSILSPALIVCRHFDDGPSGQGKVISYFSFGFHFSNNEQC